MAQRRLSLTIPRARINVTTEISLLDKYRGRKLTPKKRLEYLTLCVETVFGYGSLDRSFVEDQKLDVQALAKEKGWHCEEGSLNFGFWRGGNAVTLKFGEKPDKKQLKRLVKEAKARKHE